MKRSAIKRSRPKTTKIRQSARGEDCTINLEGVCSYDPDTVVWCHSNRASDGKAMGRKADDDRGAYGCSSCHKIYDRQAKRPDHLSLDDVEEAFTLAMEKSRAILVSKGLVSFYN